MQKSLLHSISHLVQVPCLCRRTPLWQVTPASTASPVMHPEAVNVLGEHCQTAPDFATMWDCPLPAPACEVRRRRVLRGRSGIAGRRDVPTV